MFGFGKNNAKAATEEEHLQKNDEIVQAFGATIMECDMTCVAFDESTLPYTKDEIQRALAIAIAHSSSMQQTSVLVEAYLHTSRWQQGVGKTPIGAVRSPSVESMKSGEKPSQGDPERDASHKSLANTYMESNKGRDEWEVRVASERERLKQSIAPMLR